MLLDHLLDLAFDGIQIKASRLLHRWIFDGRLCRLGDYLLDDHEAPELARIEFVSIAESHSKGSLAAKR